MPNPFRVPFGRKVQRVNIDRGPYVMEMSEDSEASITMYGEIVETQPRHPWSGELLEGDYIVQGEFLKDLESVANAKILTIHMHSIGGDAGVSILIHNRLRELAAKKTHLICIVDGVAMSGGSLIMAACDEVHVNPSSLIMIHKSALSLWCSCNADDMRQYASELDAWDKAQVSIYKRKCGLSDTVIANMMAKTTYMTGTEAVEKGFADKLLEEARPLDIAASADGRSFIVQGRQLHLMPGMFVPDTIPTVLSEAAASVETKNMIQPVHTGDEGGNVMAKNLEELRAENPALAEQLMAEARAVVSVAEANGSPSVSATDAIAAAVQAEQKRLQEIDAVASLYDVDTVQAAKYGESACTAQEMTYRAAQKAAQQGKKFLADMAADALVSGTGAVSAVPPAEDKNGGNSLEQARADARAFNARKKEVR